MSDNKMGSVPSETRRALYKMLEKVNSSNDHHWAEAIKLLTALGAEVAVQRMSRPDITEAGTAG